MNRRISSRSSPAGNLGPDPVDGLAGVEVGEEEDVEDGLDGGGCAPAPKPFRRRPIAFGPRMWTGRWPATLQNGTTSLVMTENPPMKANRPIRQNWWTALKADDHDAVVDLDVAAQGGRVDQDDLVPDPAVVGDVGVGHEIAVVADPGQAAALDRPPVDGDEFAEDVPVADPDPGLLALVADVLGLGPDRGERGEPVVGADLGPAADEDVGLEDRVRADRDILADDAARADPDALVQPGLRDGRRPRDG